MSKFIKVAQWNSGHYGDDPDILYINVNLVKKFYRVNDSYQYNFRSYTESLGYVKNPTKIITNDGEMYYSPIDLNNTTKIEVDDIESRFDIIDL